MPKENTHVFFANRVFGEIKKIHPEVSKIIEKNLYQYQVGSYLPDIFFYNKKYSKVSKNIHGERNNLTNILILQLLDKTESNDQKSLSFIFGILTHFASDITLHPMINSQSRNFYEHVRSETALDEKINSRNNLLPPIKKEVIKSTKAVNTLEDYFKIKKGGTLKIYQRHNVYNKIFRSIVIYIILASLKKIKWFNDKGKLGLFYGNLLFNKIEIKNKYTFINPATDKTTKKSVTDLFDKSCHLAINYIISAYDYKEGKINKSDLINIIRGESLTTGKISK